MLNTGIAFSHAFESEYNAYRRFLVANRKYTIRDIRDDLKSLYEKKIRFKPNVSSMEISQLYEKDKCAQLGLPYGLMEDVRVLRKKIRNCEECARCCYHSDLYQLPWLTLCPIHDLPLTDTCPDCQNPWPTPGKLRLRKCQTCGTHFQWEGFIRFKTFQITQSGLQKLYGLYHCLKNFNNLDKGFVVKLHADKELWASHATIDNLSQVFPAIMSTYDPVWETCFRSCGILVTGIEKFNYDVYSRYNFDKSSYSHDLQSCLAIHAREHMKEKIKQAIRSRFKVNDFKLKSSFYFNPSGYVKSISQMATVSYNIWNDLTNGQAIYPYYIFDRYVPIVPCIVDTIRFYKDNKMQAMFDTNHSFCDYNVPEAMQIKLYEADLWRVYINILRYLDMLRYLVVHQLSWIELYERLPSEYLPVLDNDQQYAIFKLSEYELVLLLPKEQVTVSLEDYQLIS